MILSVIFLDIWTPKKLLQRMILKQLGPCYTLIEVSKDPRHEQHQNLVTAGWRWWHTPLNPGLGRQRQMDLYEFELRPAWSTGQVPEQRKATQRNPVLKEKKKANLTY